MLRTPESIGGLVALFVLEQRSDTVRVGARLRSGGAAFAEFDATKLPAEAGQLPAPLFSAAVVGRRKPSVPAAAARPA